MKTTFLYILISVFLCFFIVGCMKSVKFIAPEISIESFCEKGNVKCLKKEALAKRIWEVRGTPTGEVTFEKVTSEHESVKITVKDDGGFSLTAWVSGLFEKIGGIFDKPQIQLPID